MPRDGSGNYTKPFDPVVDGTTIEPTVYNGFVDDAATQFIGPTPVLSGGTNATDAPTALFNLGGEKSTQVVGGDTDFNTHVFVPGSFRAAAGVTGAPNGTATFAGHCYINEVLANPPTNQNVVVEARDMTTGLVYSRLKTAGVWGAWATIPVPPSAGTTGQLQYNNAGVMTGVGGSSVYADGSIVLNSGTITNASVHPIWAVQTWNNAAGIFCGHRIDITASLYDTRASFIECRSSLVSKFKVGIQGVIKSGGFLRGLTTAVTNSTVLAGVTGLAGILAANQHYLFETEIYVTCAAAGGVRAAIGGDATTSNLVYTGYAIADNAIKGKATGTAYNTVVANTLTTETSGIIIRITGQLTTTSSGAIYTMFAQNTANATSTIALAGSWLRVYETA